ncbi:MAG TPA: helix-turn-helix transcriptional regulator [Paracoccaceae bacterium]|nr:helix-turn-helix transcriptional regulator [Paracoccaceae bacterium]
MAHPIDIHVGQRVRQARLLAGITQQQLAAETGVTFQQIQKYEKGLNRISASRLYQFSEILRVNIEDFFSGYDDEEPIRKSEVPISASFKHQSLALMDTFSRIEDSETRARIVKLVQSIAGEL